ncbi:sodium- and chloride-dependent GABA transporter 1-like isoform X2 [Homarus americanus]|uniref:sodium- and chloride-dependent GABA transporter 1-like isoform X2 n=1 Tax=Homarus americanus TaxID=6706 RepID=UPI001C43693A|nr:sodium- and chloride-dependent GABA transporter 1-like isoform X2 [Homarus americanus]
MDTDLNVAYIRYPPTTANEPPDGPCHVCDEYGSCHTCNSHAHTCFIKPAGGPKGTKEEDRSARGGGMSQSQQDTTAASQHSEVDNAKGVGGSIYKIEESEVGSKMSLSQDSSTERGNWQTKWDYFLSVAGFSIGLANVWRFPYLCYMNGGGAFLVPYLLVLVVVGLPLYLLESALGQFSSCSCFTLYEVCPIFKGVGYATFIMNLVFVAVYSVVIAYPLVFLYNSFSTKLPWSSCGNTWNTPACSLAENRNSTLAGDSQQLSPADEFFHNFILEISDDITELDGFLWPVVGASFFIWTFVFLTVFKGINVFGKVVWFTAIFPFIMLFTLLIRGLTLPGAWDGIYFYIWPNFEKLKELKVWAAAAGQIFYSLGPGWGILTTLGSYNKFHNKCQRDAVLVPILNCATSILAGFVVFSVLGFMAHRTGTTVEKVTSAGPALVFITYPEALSLMPFAPLWAVLFFLMIFFLGIDSMIAHIETTTVSFVDEFPQYRHRRGLVTFLVCFFDMLASLLFCTRGGIYWLTLVDWYSASYTLILNCLCEILIFGLIYGAGRTVRDLQIMTTEKVSYYWYVVWLAAAPTVLLLIFINTMVSNAPASYRGEAFPGWAQGIGWLTALVSMLAIPIYFFYYLTCASSGSLSQITIFIHVDSVWSAGCSQQSHGALQWRATGKSGKLCVSSNLSVTASFTRTSSQLSPTTT